MRELSKAEKIEKAEKDFLDRLFDTKSQVKPLFMNRGESYYTENKKYFLLGQFVRDVVEVTQQLMNFFHDDEEARIQFLAQRNIELLDAAIMHYVDINGEKPSDSFIEFLHKKFYEATSLNYKEKLNERDKLVIIEAMILKLSLSELQNRLDRSNRATDKMIFDAMHGYVMKYISNKLATESMRKLLNPNIQSGIYLYRSDFPEATYAWIVHDDKTEEILNLTELDSKKQYETNPWNHPLKPDGFKQFILSNSQYALKSKQKLEKISKAIRKRSHAIMEVYKKATEAELSHFLTLASTIILLSLFGLLIEPTAAILLITLAMVVIAYDRCYREPHKTRKMNTKTQIEYCNSLQENLSKVPNIENKQILEKKARHPKTTPEEKALCSAYAQKHYFYSLKSFTKVLLVENKNNKTQRKKPLDITTAETKKSDYVFVPSESHQNESDIRKQVDNNLENLRKYYPRYKKEVEKHTNTKEIPIETSYEKTTYQLPTELESQGCLAKKDHSYAYFDLGGFRDQVDQDIIQNFKNNEYAFGSNKGSFNVFKNINDGNYRLKLFDGRRIDFKPTGNIELVGSDGSRKSAPRYEAFQCGRK